MAFAADRGSNRIEAGGKDDLAMKTAPLGTGLMGQAVTTRLLQFDDPVVVFNRTREKATWRPLTTCCSPQDSRRPDLSGRSILQAGTISPAESMKLKSRIEASKGEYLDEELVQTRPPDPE
jgi:3-hydroxyisobutyrate dehydrogenase-like beta-hydroxyacid dehydrogenase